MPTRSTAADSLAFERYIAQHSRSLGLDPAAVLAVASTEGGFRGPSSSPGDHGTSFGPFQLHIGGALPANVKDPQTWAWSKEGIDYALGRIQSVAANKGGEAAVTSIVYNFERPQNPAAETATALSRYNSFSSFNVGTEQGLQQTLPGPESDPFPKVPLPSGGAVPGLNYAKYIGDYIGKKLGLPTPSGIEHYVQKKALRFAELLAGVILFVLGLSMMGKAGITSGPARQVRGAVA